MSENKNPIDKFVYGIRDSFKNIKKAFAESEVVHKCIKRFLPANKYSKEISVCAGLLQKLLDAGNIVSTDKEFNIFYRMIKNMQPYIQNDILSFGYVYRIFYFACLSKYPNITGEQSKNMFFDFMQKSDYDLSEMDEEIMKEVSEKMTKLITNIRVG